jgi:hypothetical protein
MIKHRISYDDSKPICQSIDVNVITYRKQLVPDSGIWSVVTESELRWVFLEEFEEWMDLTGIRVKMTCGRRWVTLIFRDSVEMALCRMYWKF